jgi:hypothetical protein
MKPEVICLMASRLDGRTLPSRWRPKGAPSVFDSTEAESDQRAPITAMTLEESRALAGGALWLRYRIQNEAQA